MRDRYDRVQWVAYMDIHSKRTRSYNMSQIKGKDTKPETIVRKFLFSNGFRYRKNDKRYPGTPDIVLPKYRTVIFINGCFWHGHEGCKYYVIHKTNTEFWLNKINSNISRDSHQYKQLKEMGWRVIIIWECQLKPTIRNITLEKILSQISSSD